MAVPCSGSLGLRDSGAPSLPCRCGRSLAPVVGSSPSRCTCRNCHCDRHSGRRRHGEGPLVCNLAPLVPL
eukprot:13640720-Heterocapsa_arctica.AAC.1